ncbi:MAG: hypothetical protein F6K44_07700, partial [Moorea sp. SIO3E2]|nr:hypothetical protein [Moorena sp. SIO3E2]
MLIVIHATVEWYRRLWADYLAQQNSIAEVICQKSFVRSQTLALLDAIASGGNPQDRNGAFSVGELNSPRVAPL